MRGQDEQIPRTRRQVGWELKPVSSGGRVNDLTGLVTCQVGLSGMSVGYSDYSGNV